MKNKNHIGSGRVELVELSRSSRSEVLAKTVRADVLARLAWQADPMTERETLAAILVHPNANKETRHIAAQKLAFATEENQLAA